MYSITDAGRAFLHENRDRADDVADRLSDIAERFAGAPVRDVALSFMRLAQVSWEEAARHAGDAEARRRAGDPAGTDSAGVLPGPTPRLHIAARQARHRAA